MQDQTKRYSITHEKRIEKRTDVYEINLTIPIFTKLLKTTTMSREYRTPKNTIIQVPDSQFQLKICFLGRKNELMEIYYLSTNSVFLKSNLQLSLGNFAETYLSKDYRRVLANKWQYCAVVKEPAFRGESSNDTLYITCKFKVSRDVKVEQSHVETTPQLSDDLGILLTDGTYSDITLKSAEGVEFRVHKNVLAIRSNVLKAHFEHNTIESKTNIVETAWETEVLRDLLIFLYTDTAPRVDNDPGKLLAAADYYQLLGLKSICEKALCKRLTVENAIETLQLAELHSVNTLTEYTLEFIKEGRARLIVETEGWANVQSVEIIKRIYEFIMSEEKDNTDILSAAYNELS